MKSSSAKAKGRALQKWVCAQISELTGFEWGEDAPISSRPMGKSGTDVRLESQVQKVFPFAVECKNQQTWAVPAWIKQARSNQVEGTEWLLVMKRNHQQAVVCMDAVAFFKLLKEVKK